MSDIDTKQPKKFIVLMAEKNGQGGCVVGPFDHRDTASEWLEALIEEHPHIGLNRQNHTLLGVAQLVTVEEFKEAADKVKHEQKAHPESSKKVH